jgi:hypothetical protein
MWTHWPVAAGDDIQSWDTLIELWFGLRERYAVAGNDSSTINAWPPGNAWWTGTIADATDNGDGTITLSFSSVNWDVDTAAGCGPQRWVGYTCTGTCPPSYIPSSYDAVIEPDFFNPIQTVRGHIQSETYTSPGPAAGSVTIAGGAIFDAITAGFIPSLASLAGKPCSFVRASSGSASTERLPTQPMDRALWVGTASTGSDGYWPVGSGPGTGTHYSTIHDTSAASVQIEQAAGGWAQDQWATGDEVLVTGSDGRLKRLTIRHNTGNTLYVDYSASLTYSGAFGIVTAGKRYMPGVDAWRPFQWYAGAANAESTHLADDTIGTWPEAASTVQWGEGNPCGGTPCDSTVTHGSFDVDVQVEIDNLCEPGRAGNYLVPKFWHSLRAIQNGAVSVSGSFLEKNFTIEGAACLHLYTPAKFYIDAGCDGGTSLLTYAGGGDWSFAVDPTFNGRTVYYAIWPNSGCTPVTGTALVSGGQVTGITSGFLTAPGTCGATADTGATVYYSPGWTRYKGRQVRYLFPKTVFIPDTSPPPSCYPTIADPPAVNYAKNASDCTVILPATYDCFGRGTWLSRAASSKYAEYSAQGVMGDGGSFVEGDLVRYVGDNAADPFVSGAGALDGAYWDRFYRGTYGPTLQAGRDGGRGGQVLTATTYSLTGKTNNWWNDGITTHVLRTETGTATGGSATTLADSSKNTTDNTQPWGCWYDPARWNGEHAPYVGCILEITQGGTVYKVPTTNCTFGAGGVTFTFAAVAGLTVAAGATYQIREPAYEIDTWAGRRLQITHAADGSVSTYWIRHNDDVTLYVDAQAQPIAQPGDAFSILEPAFGTVWRWTATAPSGGVADTTWWPLPTGAGYLVKPTGMDAVRVAVPTPAKFLDDQRNNLESFVKDYGPILPGDAICVEVLNQLYKGIDNLRWTKVTGSWLHHVSGEITTRSGSDDTGATLAQSESRAADDWAVETGTADVDNAPKAEAFLETIYELSDNHGDFTCSYADAEMTRQKGYLKVTIPSAPLSAALEFCLHSTVDAGGCNIGIYNPQGDNVSASNNTWHVFDTASVAPGPSTDYWSIGVGQCTDPLAFSGTGSLTGGVSYSNWTWINPDVFSVNIPYGSPFVSCEMSACFASMWFINSDGSYNGQEDIPGQGGTVVDTGSDYLVTLHNFYNSSDPNLPPTSGTAYYEWGSNTYAGYKVTDQCAILKWDVTGGFTYVS